MNDDMDWLEDFSNKEEDELFDEKLDINSNEKLKPKENIKDKSDKHLNYMLESAFDFLERSIDQLEAEPKYSIINFCTAIELILKARLVSEHWSLIVKRQNSNDKNNPISIKDFESGDAITLGFNELIPFIDGLTEKIEKKGKSGKKLGEISIEVEECFKNIAKHRNKIIHFYHKATINNALAKEKEIIASEQYTAWFYLKSLLEKWKEKFNIDQSLVEKIERNLIETHKPYLQIKFNKLKPEIDKEKKQGIIYNNCTRCDFEATKEQKLTEYVFVSKCIVCSMEKSFFIKVKCQNDDCKEIIIIDEHLTECPECGENIDKKELIELLDTNPITHDNEYDQISINCSDCGEMGYVINHYNYYICINCFAITQDVEYCQYCNEGEIFGSDLDLSFLDGCGFCDGRGYDD